MKRRTFIKSLLAFIPLLPAKTLYADIEKANKFGDDLHDSLRKGNEEVSRIKWASYDLTSNNAWFLDETDYLDDMPRIMGENSQKTLINVMKKVIDES